MFIFVSNFNNMVRRPFNIHQWIEENKDLLKPPVGNKNIYKESGDYIVMMVGGPNARKDYHYNETEELFYQFKGDIVVGIQEEGKAVDIEIKEGEMFLLPAKVPHQPRRGEGSVGLVIEVKRNDRPIQDGLMWFCEKCNHKLHEVYFSLGDITSHFQVEFKKFYGSEDLRTCKSCGHVMEPPPTVA